MSDNTMLANQMYDQTFKIDVYHSVLYVVSSDDQAQVPAARGQTSYYRRRRASYMVTC